MSSLKPVFTFNVGQKIVPGTVAIGKFDGVRSSLTAAIANSKVFIHTAGGGGDNSIANNRAATNRHELTTSAAGLSILNVNQSVRAVAIGALSKEDGNGGREVLLVGTGTHLLAYDVHNNSDLFYREVTDGVNCIEIGRLNDQLLAICGGNCAVQGFDAQGHDPFWTVTGDNVTAICLTDFDGDGKNELIVGSEDFDLRVFKGDEIIGEINETDAFTVLKALDGIPGRFAYALANGTLGIYQGANRLWRIKSKNLVISMCVYDIDGDDRLELAVGWTNGKLDFRSIDTGEVLLKEQMQSAIAGLTVGDYRLDGSQQLIACSVDGQVVVYLAPNLGGSIVHTDPSQDILREFSIKKQTLMVELNNYEETSKYRSSKLPTNRIDAHIIGAIPTNTHLETSIYVNAGSDDCEPCVQLELSTSNDTLIRAVMVFAEGIFAGESHVVMKNSSHPYIADISNKCLVQLRPDKDMAVDLHVKALIGYRNSLQYHVFELTRALPKFSMYALCNDSAPPPDSNVQFDVAERPQRLALWVNENFLLHEEITCNASDRLDVKFYSLRGSGMLFIDMNANGNCTIRCDDIELAGNIVQAIADFFGVHHLASSAHFPHEIETLNALIEKTNQLYSLRDQLSAQMADRSNLVKALLVRAEDSRIISHWSSMKKYYTQLYSVNQELVSEYRVRCNNHDELLRGLKLVNQLILRAARLRVGKPSSDLITACRQAIKTDSSHLLAKLIQFGAG